ncbi:cupin domain-containing protein [Amycolatopsis minnesotensis]|uniref:Cupin domain-containing protein n=1 Tax=Amycolatopsis minnesotensis TaxID=337894 RepID=A0ABN2S203_9PSEU
MTEISRRNALGTGAGVAAAIGLGGASAASPAAAAAPAAAGPPKPPGHAHVFPLSKTAPTTFDGGTLRGANEDTFPVLAGQNGSVYLVHLDVGGIREPHWHPNAWELNYIISGTAKWTILGTHADGSYHNDVFESGKGELVFAPTGFFHYFENASTTESLDVLVIFNTSTAEPNDDIGIVGTLNSLPRDVLGAVFGVPASAFGAIPQKIEPVVITKRK